MPALALTVIGLTLLGNAFVGEPFEPYAGLVNLQTELSAPMFHGTVQAIDRDALRVTIRTDFGRLVPVTVERCAIIQRLRIGDRVRLDVDAQGVVRALKTPRSPAGASGRCPEDSI